MVLRRRRGAAAESVRGPAQRHVALGHGADITCRLLAYKQLISVRETTFKRYILHQLEPFIPFRDWIRRNPKINPYYITVKTGPSVSLCRFFVTARRGTEIASWIRKSPYLNRLPVYAQGLAQRGGQVSHQLYFEVIKNP